ncbi:uncharacterized protein F4807DRAFT_410179 [Annulohypoxylon truncatum]|uniref:uncharacterized protein n=1 Tax=Annulohypoxylon truncatum TaxID=327061 RepID=UPI0020076E45|nr:uncharacterized protein F4807DRAFT_410179 [Annulohypoxylon truncatum]KAI1213220.1 hypothetical protein F4807DRAFT_410179 [Annulohypoxylon truncatum]
MNASTSFGIVICFPFSTLSPLSPLSPFLLFILSILSMRQGPASTDNQKLQLISAQQNNTASCSRAPLEHV